MNLKPLIWASSCPLLKGVHFLSEHCMQANQDYADVETLSSSSISDKVSSTSDSDPSDSNGDTHTNKCSDDSPGTASKKIGNATSDHRPDQNLEGEEVNLDSNLLHALPPLHRGPGMIILCLLYMQFICISQTGPSDHNPILPSSSIKHSEPRPHPGVSCLTLY